MVEPLIPFDFYARFIKVGLNKGDNRVSQMKELVDKLPKENYGQCAARSNVVVEGKSERVRMRAAAWLESGARKSCTNLCDTDLFFLCFLACASSVAIVVLLVCSDAVAPVRLPVRGCRAFGQQQDGAG